MKNKGFTSPSRGMSEAKDEQQSTEMLSIWCCCERLRLLRGRKAHQSDKAAFTLAEVLITLGIIGVVAALTMPALMTKYEKKVNAVRVKQAFSIISNAIKLSEVENGEAKYWDGNLSPDKGIRNTELFLKKYILPYMNKPVFCGEGLGDDVVNKCGATVSSAGQTYMLANGISVAFVSKGSRNSSNETEILYVIVDINGPKRPNKLGSDKFYFVLNPNKGFIPFGGGNNINREDILRGINVPFDGGSSFISCKQSKSEDNPNDNYRHGCTLLLMMDGWEFKDDYPW